MTNLIHEPAFYFTQREQITQKVKEILIRALSLDLKTHEIDHDAPLFGTGLALDSVDALELIVSIENEFDKSLGEDQKPILRSVNTIVDFIMAPSV